MSSSSMNGTNALRVDVSLAERDAIKLILDFLQQRELYISMLDVERETGVINGSFSEDILFLRQLILDGQWDDVIDFVQPLKNIDSFDANPFIFIVLKHQFLELLCLKTESQIENDLAVEQIVKFLNDLKPFAPNDHEYKKLSFLLTLTRLQDHTDYSNWNPSTGRVQCFQEILPLIYRFLQVDKQVTPITQNDRLIQLLIKGLLYESCVEHCQARATNTDETIDLTDSSSLLSNTRLSETDVSLLSWLHSLPSETFSCPFEQKSLSLKIDRFQKPVLEAAWAEHILSTPFKPQTMFPFNATPTSKPKSMELMSRSFAAHYDGLTRSQVVNTNGHYVSDLTRSLAVSHLKDNGTVLPTVSEERAPSQSQSNVFTEYQKSRAEILKHFDEEEETPVIDNPKIRAIHESLDEITRSPTFVPLVSLEDVQAIRAVDVHPTGRYFAVGSNSKMLRVCAYPEIQPRSRDLTVQPAKVLLKKGKHHQGSIYCIGWSPSGRLLATGSNDKIIKVLRLDMDRPEELSNSEIELTHHNGTIRDLIFMRDRSKDDSMLLSAGAGDCHVYLTDVNKQQTIKSFAGHQGHIYSLFTWDNYSFVSASQDGTCRIWDIRQSDCLHLVPARPSKSPVAAVAIDDSGQLLAAGYEDASCLLYDLRGKRTVQVYQPHASEIRSKAVLTNLSGDLTKPLVLSSVATHTDKIIQARWHPTEMSFVTSSADRTCVVWGVTDIR